MCLKGIVVIVTVGKGGVNKARKYGKVCCCKYSKNIKKSSTFVRDRHRYLLQLHGNMFEKNIPAIYTYHLRYILSEFGLRSHHPDKIFHKL